MQSSDETGKIVSLYTVEELTSVMGARDLAEKIKEAEARGAVSHTIGRLPEKGKHFTLGGLEYEVGYVDHKRGKLHAKLVEGPGVGEIAGEVGERDMTLHEICAELANRTVQENGMGNEIEGFSRHISFVNEEELGLKMPVGKMVKVTVEFVDETEATPPL